MRNAKSNDRRRQRLVPTVWARVVATLARRAEVVGIERERLLARAGLSVEDLADPDGRIAIEALYALVEAIVDLSGDPLALMQLTRELELESFDVLAFVVMTSPTLRAGLRAMIRYQRLFADGERYALEEDGTWARIVYTPWGPPRRAHGHMAEMFAVDIIVNAASMTGTPFDRPRVRFAHTLSGDRARERALLDGVEPERGGPRNEIWVRRADLDRRIAPEGQAAICAYFTRHLDERVRSLSPTSIAGSIRDTLMRARLIEPNMASLARKLHMSARTLQRRLNDEGTSLRTLVDEIRLARALPLLDEGHSIAEIAYVLGYTEPSAFHRAFRRWTSETPDTYRARSLARRAV